MYYSSVENLWLQQFTSVPVVLQPRCHFALCWAGVNLEVCLHRKSRREGWVKGNQRGKKVTEYNNKDTTAEEEMLRKEKWENRLREIKLRGNKSGFCLVSFVWFECSIFYASVKWHVHLSKFASGTHLYIHLCLLSHLLSLFIIFSRQHISPFPLWVSVLHYWNNSFHFLLAPVLFSVQQLCV